MTRGDEFTVRFWGVRGSIPAPGTATARYGGNTACLAVEAGPYLLVLDAGSGLRELGKELAPRNPVEADILLSHTHYDHVCGLPFFAPLYRAGNRFRLWAGHLLPERELEGVVRQLLSPPLFPVPPEAFAAEVAFRDFAAGETLTPRPGVVVKTARLNHPDRATGYRVEFAGRAFCYVTDTEHVEGRRDENILALADGADVFVYDSNYTEEEFPAHRGLGHSTWQEGMRLAEAAGVKTFVLFHHDPDHDDGAMDKIGAEAARRRPGTVVAREGLVLAP